MELPYLMEGNCPRLVPSGLFYLACLQEFLLGGFASHSRLELLVSRFLPTQLRWSGLLQPSGPTVGWVNDDGDQPTPSNCSTASTHSLHLFYPWWSLFNWGWGVNWRGGPPSFLCQYHPHCSQSQHSLLTTPLPLPVALVLFLPY